MGPLVTVFMPVYNGGKYLREAIDSILNQTYTNLDFLIIDDGSTDNSLETILSYADPRIRLVKNETNLGLTPTLNKGVDLVIGKYVARMDADDISMPTRLEKEVQYLETHPEVTMIDVVNTFIDKDGNTIHKSFPDVFTEKEIRKSLPDNNYLGHPSMMIRTEVYKKYKYRLVQFEDYDLWLRLANDNYIIHKINEPLLKYRLHGNSYTDSGRKKKCRDTQAGYN